jgi:hypothetical protein
MLNSAIGAPLDLSEAGPGTPQPIATVRPVAADSATACANFRLHTPSSPVAEGRPRPWMAATKSATPRS